MGCVAMKAAKGPKSRVNATKRVEIEQNAPKPNAEISHDRERREIREREMNFSHGGRGGHGGARGN
jgi:hypothetical protein